MLKIYLSTIQSLLFSYSYLIFDQTSMSLLLLNLLIIISKGKDSFTGNFYKISSYSTTFSEILLSVLINYQSTLTFSSLITEIPPTFQLALKYRRARKNNCDIIVNDILTRKRILHLNLWFRIIISPTTIVGITLFYAKIYVTRENMRKLVNQLLRHKIILCWSK